MVKLLTILLFVSSASFGQLRKVLANPQLISGYVPPTYATLNPADKASGITLSGGNLTMAGCGCAGPEVVRATSGKSSGKWYFEVTCTSIGSAQIGIEPNTESLSNPVGFGAASYSYLNDGTKYNNNSQTSYAATYTNGDIIGVAVDLTGNSITFYKNGVSLGAAFTITAGTYYPALGSNWSASTMTANFGASAFAYSVPSGYNSGWY